MKEIVAGMMAGLKHEAVEYLCQESYQVYQVRELVQAFLSGLTLEQIRTFASKELSAIQIHRMWEQLAQKKQEEQGLTEYMKQILEVMGAAVQKFSEENQKFESLKGVLSHHLLEEKEKEIQRLEENLKFKNEVIRKLKKQLEEKETIQPQEGNGVPNPEEIYREQPQQKEMEEEKTLKEPFQTEHPENFNQQDRLGTFARLFGGQAKRFAGYFLKTGIDSGTTGGSEEMSGKWAYGFGYYPYNRNKTVPGKDGKDAGNSIAYPQPKGRGTWLSWTMRSF